MDAISSLQKLLDLEFDCSQVRLEFDERPDNAVILGEMTAEEIFLFKAVFFCSYRLKVYKEKFEQINVQSTRELELDEVNNKVHYWYNQLNLCNILLANKVCFRLEINYSNYFYVLPGYLICIDLDGQKDFIGDDIDGKGHFINHFKNGVLFIN